MENKKEQKKDTIRVKKAESVICRLYRGRCDAENRIKKLKYDFSF